MSYFYDGYASEDGAATGSNGGGENWSAFFQGLTKTVVSGYASQEAAAQQQDYSIQRMQASNPAFSGDRMVKNAVAGNSTLLMMLAAGVALYLVLK